ncbi:T6SS effector BTH_I2691 family protein [Caldimonas caldifontis]|uniref:Toxin VasX N-terminal region domain-containing protein n=1 Tax=Caldimonas caldifontis TaxID=1452508 RepID=A0A2S5SY94_9BURK|nr:T6SS effector BTH_I2691 family protein [Caldimonas caldifontis]PPE67691.1 hypothetical protein C1704_02170 [Caldimonas caldifontis]
MNASAKECRYCHKSGLSLLLLRPSPIALHSDLQAPGSAHARPDPELVAPFTPQGLTQTRPVLRLLRAGYVHLYIPKTNQWRTWRVTEQAHLLAQDHPAFGVPSAETVCTRAEHNASGFRLLPIAQAHELMGQSIWLAFSANLWSDGLKARNRANPQAMVEVRLGTTAAPAFKPDAQNLRRQVLECNVPAWHLPRIEARLQPLYPFNSLARPEQIEHMAQTLRQAAAAHPKTAGHELAVVLPDPLGYAAELNALRLARHELTKQALARPEHSHPLASLHMLEGLRQAVIDEQEAHSWEAVSPVMNGGAFKDLMRVRPHPRGWPEGTRWEPFTAREDLVQHGPGMGRVVFPDHAQRAERWALEAAQRNWQRYRNYLDEAHIGRWRQQFEQTMRAAHGEPQARLETDWMAALHSPELARYLNLHFDDQDPNRVGTAQDHSPGEAFAREVASAWTPAPLSEAQDLNERYRAQLDKRPTDADAYVWHALLGNQAALKEGVAQYLLDQRADKLHDLSAGLFTALEEGMPVHPFMARYSWLTRPGFVGASLVITQSWTSLLGLAAATMPTASALAGQSSRLQQRLTGAMMVSRTIALAGHSAVQQSALRRPLLVEIELSLQEARDLMARRRAAGADALSNTQLKRMAGPSREARIRLQLATDTVEARAAGVAAADLAASGAGSVAGAAAARAAAAAAPAGALRVSEEVFARLVHAQAHWQHKAVALTDELARALPGAALTLEGQIGLLGLWINGVGVVSNFEKWSTSGSALDFVNTVDALLGTVAGGAQVAEAAWGASLTHRLGEQAAKRAVSVAVLQAVGSVAGAASGFSLTVGQGIKAARSISAGNEASAAAYFSSTGAALGFTASSGILAWGAVAGVINRRLGTQGALWRGAARARLANMAVRRVSTHLGLRAATGLGLGLTGWGLILLGLTLVGEVVAIVLTPSAQQEFIRRTYFGVGPTKFATLDEEILALEALGQGVNPADAAREARRPQSISELGPMP